MTDNTELLTIMIGKIKVTTPGASAGVWTKDPQVTIEKTTSVSSATLPATVDYKVVITNTGGEVYNATLTDTLTDPEGDIVYSRSWDLKTIERDDEITLTYSVEYDADTMPGTYNNIARLTGQMNNSVAVHAVDMPAVEASASVELLPGEEGEVLGEETDEGAILPAQCAAFITSYLKPGAKNSETQVKRLQYFLRDFEGAALTVNGIYDTRTIAAVGVFQKKYKDDVLVPWGMEEPSGTVFYTTQKKINEIYCQGISEFPLSSLQSHQILAYKKGGNAPAEKPWSAIELPPIAQFNFFPPTLAEEFNAPAPVSTPAFAGFLLENHSILTLLRDIFNSIAYGLMAEHVQAAGNQ